MFQDRQGPLSVSFIFATPVPTTVLGTEEIFDLVT
jgi:hypothetical protein